MENEYRVIKDCNDPEVLVITPLLPGHKISKETKKTIKRNDTQFRWITSTGKNNIPTNIEMGLDWYIKEYKVFPKFLFPLDNDIILGRKTIDRLVKTLARSDKDVAFCYASFEFKGTVDRKFPADPYDIKRLLQHNYISSNSLFKTIIVYNIGFVTDNKYQRLLDYAMILKLFYNGYKGIPCSNANFIAISSEKDVSAQSGEDYKIKRERVLKDFGKPLTTPYFT